MNSLTIKILRMKIKFKAFLSTIAVLCLVTLFLIPHESEARVSTRYNPCICYTYYSDGTIMQSETCDAPSATGACAKIVRCVPPLPNDEE